MASDSKVLLPCIQKVVLVDEVIRSKTATFRSSSLDGHLIHVVIAGEVRQESEGRPEHFGRNTVVWYHRNEPVEGRVIRAPWRFITINFDAPTLPPPPECQRVIPVGPKAISYAQDLLRYWRDDHLPTFKREILVIRALGDLLLEFHDFPSTPTVSAPVYPANSRDLWWNAEKQIRKLLDQPMSLESIAEIASMSVRTTIRACKAATGLSPMRRLHELRIAHATHLLQHSDFPITEVGARVGFERVQEFSRDYKLRTGRTPSQARAAAPDYRAPK